MHVRMNLFGYSLALFCYVFNDDECDVMNMNLLIMNLLYLAKFDYELSDEECDVMSLF